MSFNHFDPIPDNLFCVMFVDTSYGGGGDEEIESLLEKNRIEDEFSIWTEDVDIYPGASLPAFLFEVSLVGPAVAIALTTAFFQGKNIKENFAAWVGIANGLKRFFGKEVHLNRSAAGALALQELLKNFNGKPEIVRLVKYSTFDTRFERFEDATEHQVSLRLEYHACTNHIFDFDVDGRNFVVVVDGSDVGLKELN